MGALEVVYGGPGVRVIYAKGEYQQTILPNIRGQAVVTIDWKTTPAPDGSWSGLSSRWLPNGRT